MKFKIPQEVAEVIKTLIESGYSAYIVGGSVRDLLRGAAGGESVEPKDWDIATDAKPEKLQELFPGSIYENKFGTVGVKTDSDEKELAVVEVTTFRKEEKYSDLRHPDKVDFTSSIEEDLARRDFTINAMALSPQNEVIDPFGGRADLKEKIIRAVGEPAKRFGEDALRLMRAVRISAELEFSIEDETRNAIKDSSELLGAIAKERIRDELVKIIMSPGSGPMNGIERLEELDLLKYIIPELREGIGVTQNKHHIYTVWEHNLLALDYTAKKDYSFEVRMASLLHDVAKPRVKEGEGPNSTFYNHEFVGAKMARGIMDNLHFSKEVSRKVAHLVRYHMFYYNVDEVTPAGVRRFLKRVGPENVPDLIKLREADRIGSGVPKAVPYKLRHFLFMIEKVKADPVGPKMLKLNGEEVMKLTGNEPGPRVGWILAVLLEEVLDDPKKNSKKHLSERVKDLNELGDKELEKKAHQADERKEEFESGLEEGMKKKYYVK